MRAVILAAGRGERLGAEAPKPLVEIAPGKTLLSNQIELLAPAVGVDRIHVVVGYEQDRVRAAAPTARFVENPGFAISETARSLLLGLRSVPGGEDVLWTNADLYFDAAALERLLGTARASSRLLAQLGAADAGDAEAVGVTLDEHRLGAQLGKGAPGATLESVGMHVVRSADRPALERALGECRENDLYEAALQSLIDREALRLVGVVNPGSACREIDTPDDLHALRAYLEARS